VGARKGRNDGEDGVMIYVMMLLDQLKSYVTHFKKDEDGAALIEYTVLLGILLIAVIAVITSVGGWINGKWDALNTAL
jgi:pilus assembly protein Flp/PilA